jgi:PKD repeat protein
VASTEKIAQPDCDQLAKVMLAVEMSTPPTQCGFKPLLDKNPPAQCAGATPILSEGFEAGLNGWTLSNNPFPGDSPRPYFNWTTRSALPKARTGSAAFALNDRGGTCAPGGDHSGTYALTSPAIQVPANGTTLHLRFTHYVETEATYDGGNVKISVNSGAFNIVPQDKFIYNAPKSKLSAAPPLGQNTNPKAGEWAWHGADGGEVTGSWGTSVIDLSSLAKPGDTIKIQFDFGADGCNGVTGWFVDDVSAYSCGTATATAPTASFTATPNPAQTNQSVTFDGSASHGNGNPQPTITSYAWTFGDGTSGSGKVVTHAYATAGSYTATLKVTDDGGRTATASQTIQVTTPPDGQAQGDGQFNGPNGGSARTEFDVQRRSGKVDGELNYFDRASRITVRSTYITALTIAGNKATIVGQCTINKQAGHTFTVDVVDNGPGTSDTFAITLDTGYKASGTLTSGNIDVR